MSLARKMPRHRKPRRCEAGFSLLELMIVVAIAFIAIPLTITEYMSNAVLIPFLIWSVIATSVGSRSMELAP